MLKKIKYWHSAYVYVDTGKPQKEFKISKLWLLTLLVMNVLIILYFILKSVVLQYFYSTLASFLFLIALLLVFLTERSHINRRMGVYSAFTSFFLSVFLIIYDEYLFIIRSSRSNFELLIPLVVIVPACLLFIKNILEIKKRHAGRLI